MNSQMNMTQTNQVFLSEAVSTILKLFPNAVFDERHGEFVILTGHKLVRSHLVPITGDDND
jgi:hypothetical protein